MAEDARRLRILLVQPWHAPRGQLFRSLRDAGFDPTIERVDLEPAVHAALVRGGHDVVIYAPSTPGIPRAIVEGLLRAHAPALPLVVTDPAQDPGDQVKAALERRWS